MPKQIELKKLPSEPPKKVKVKKIKKKKMPNKFVQRIKDLADVITAVGIIGAALIGVGTWATAQINKSTNEKLDIIIDKVDSAEENATRSQLLTLMSDYPENESEILKVANYYFQELNGDWYMTSLFTKWAESRGIDVQDIVTMHKK